MSDNEFPVRLARALRASPLSLEQIVQELSARGTPVSAATLSYWSTGRSLPRRARSRQAVGHLEQLLDTAPGWLTGVLSTVSPSGWDPLAVLPDHPALQSAQAELGVGLERDVAVQVLRDRLVVAPGRLTRRVFHLVRAERAGVDRLVIVHEVPREAQWELVDLAGTPRPEVVELEPAEDEAPRILVTCTGLTSALAPGEFAILHQQLLITEVSRAAQAGCELVTPRPDGTHQLIQEVAFEQQLPAWVRHSHVAPGEQEASATVELPVTAEVQRIQRHAPAGRHALVWGW